jgi:hypothetical protein
VTDEQHHHQEDEDAIDASALGGRVRIPVDRADIGPHIKWIIISIAASLFVIAAGFAWSLVK